MTYNAAQLLAARGPLPPELALPIIGGAAAALDNGYRERLTPYRDLTAANILLDFAADGSLQSVKLAEVESGSSGNIYPEATQGRELDNRADVYALGATAFELLTGGPPYIAPTLPELMVAHAYAPIPSISAANPQLPPTLDPVFARALAKAPEGRYPICEEFFTALQAAGLAPGVAVAPAFAAPGTPGTAAKPRRHMAVRLAAIGVSVAVLATAGVWLVKRMDARDTPGELPTASVQWKSCPFTDQAPDSVRSGECGVIKVPVDYEDPSGQQASIALIRFPATGARVGSLIINPGGPGESGMDAAISMLDKVPGPVRERYDLVGFDPRGVGRSQPALWCNSDADNDRLRADNIVEYTPEGVEHMESETKAFVQRCVDRMGKDFLANVGTKNVARDLDMLRAALGDDKLTYLGYSYGTRIGAAYAEAFPEHVGKMILDGAIDPNADPVQAEIDQDTAFQKAFDDFAADCAKDADCPLGDDPTQAVEVYRSLTWPLVQQPAQTKDPRGLSYTDSLVGTILAMYSPNFWSHLKTGLAELRNGTGDTLLTMADIYMRRDRNGRYDNSTDARVAINCVDKPAITDRETVIETDRRSREAAPFMSYGEFTGDAPLSTCAFWPVPPTSEPGELSVPGLPPTLVVSVTGDPATPYQAGVELARQLGGALLTYDGTQHTVVFQGEQCVDDYATAYLVDGSLPPDGARCPN